MLREKFETEIAPQLMKELNLSNVMEVPRLEKIAINMGVSDKDNPKVLEGAVKNLAKITGQKPIVTKAKKSISDFHLTERDPIGCKVTLRRDRAYEFLNKLFNAVLPGIRDFRGLSASSFDGRGNYTLGLSEQLAFPEISYKEVTATQGMDITIVTTAQTDKEGYSLLKGLGLPFKD
ncbi:50S ribosomal protein L5 [Candidatus Bipolaricaulota bacterium]|nr:50S ribosomal protein L5 [Candidatus Bipolaricaulota bacterium]